jgi:hypothetical protein
VTRGTSIRRAVAVSLCLIVCAMTGAMSGATAGAAQRTQPTRPAQNESALPVQVYIDTLGPRVVRPHTQVFATGRLVNASDTAVGDVRVRFRVRTRPVVSRSELAADAVRSEPLGDPLLSTTTALVASLEPGATVPFQVRVPADALGLGSFGVYPFAVEALAADDFGPNDTVGRTGTFLPWVPASGGFVPTRISWVLPLADTPNRGPTPVFPDDHLAGSLAAQGRLQTLMAAATSVGPGAVRPPAPHASDPQRAVPVTWAVDPALLQSVADMADPSGYAVQNGRRTVRGSGQAAAAAWLDELRRALRGGPVPDPLLALPYANVDVPALVRAGLDSDVATAIRHGRDVTTSVLGVSPDPRLGWPPGGFVTSKGLGELAAAGVRTFVLRQDAMPLTESLTFTPSAGASIATPSGPATAALYDDTLAGITAAAGRADLAAAAQVPTFSSPSPSTETPIPEPSGTSTVPTATTARMVEQRFLAETAMITAEQPAVSRDIVVVPPLMWDPAPGLAAALIADAGRVPWLTPTPLPSIVSDDAVGRGPLSYPDEARAAELPASYLTDPSNGVVAIRRELSSFRSILAPPIGPTAVSLADATLRTESAAWRDDLGTGLALRANVADNLAAKSAAVNISSSRRLITLASRRGTIPITISNDLDQAIVVRLQLTAVSSARLSAPVTAPQTIAPGRKLTNEVKAVVNQAGLFPIRAQLLTPDGRPYGPAVTLRLRSTAYGQLALGITATALGVLFVAVIIRLIRRGRRRGRGQREPAAAPSAQT